MSKRKSVHELNHVETQHSTVVNPLNFWIEKFICSIIKCEIHKPQRYKRWYRYQRWCIATKEFIRISRHSEFCIFFLYLFIYDFSSFLLLLLISLLSWYKIWQQKNHHIFYIHFMYSILFFFRFLWKLFIFRVKKKSLNFPKFSFIFFFFHE